MKSHRRFSEVNVALCLVLLTGQVFANPTGEALRAGRARFDRSAPGSLAIHQQTDKVIINWREFSIAAGETTRFLQPSASSIALNRVVTANPSRLFGNLEANGKVYLINPSGILVGRGGAVNTRGFVASTLDVSDASFLSGAKLRLSGDSEAPVVNEGSIQAIGGDVFLVGRTVENAGSIRAGTVGLGAGSEVMIVPTGRERLTVIAGNPGGGPAAKGVNNEGTIEAVSAELKAAGGNIYALAINNGGIIRATGVRRAGGRVFLSSDGGDLENSGTIVANNANGGGGFVSLAGGRNEANPSTVLNTGTIEARGDTAGTKGGEVRLTGDYVGLFGASVIDVSGHSGGGAALIGGDYHGGNPAIQNALRTSVGPNAVVRADALASGNGGKVILWSDETTRFYGSVSARGGERSGDGGFVETSGKLNLLFRGAADLSASRGRFGTLLLDPQDVVIEDVDVPPGSADDAEIADATINGADGGGGTFTISRGALEALSGSADILIEATRHITLNDLAGDLLNLATATGNSVTFRADSDDSGSGDFTMAAGDTIRTAGGAVAITGEDLTVGGIDTTGAGAVAAGATVNLNGQNMALGGTITAGSSDITVAVRAGAANGDLLLGAAAGTGLDLDAGDLDGFVTSGTVHFVAGAGGNVEVQGDVDFGALNLRLAGPDNISFQDADTLTTTGNVTLNAGTDGTGGIPGNNDGVAHVVANNLTATAGTGDIGSSGNPLTVDVNSLTASTAGAATDDIFLLDTAGGLTALNINAGAGDVSLTVTAGSVTDADAAVDITGAAVTVILNDAMPQNFGAAGNRIGTSAGTLSVDTSTGGGDQFITEANGLTALDLNAGAGDVSLTLLLGGVTDTDGSADITADQATVTLLAGTAQDFGASGDHIGTSVNQLNVNTSAGGGDQFVTEANGLTALDLNAGAGDVNLTLTLGGLADADAFADITAGTATVILSDAAAQDFGSLANAINTSVDGLSVDTSAGDGNQFIIEDSGLTALDLDAGAGDVNLTVTLGGVADTDGATDLTADQAVVTLLAGTAQDFGASGNRIGTSVNELSVDTATGGGSQFITEANGLTALNLNAGAGDVNLTLTAGGAADTDAAIDITAVNAVVMLSGAFGAAGLGNAIQTSVDNLSVDSGNADQFIVELNGLTGLNLDAGSGDVELTVAAGAVTDADGATDITAGTATVVLQDVATQAFGALANAINTSVGNLSVNTAAGGGNQFIVEANGLTGLNLNAAGGDISLTLTAGALTDTDGLTDITADQATVLLSAGSAGSLANPIQTTVNDLSVDTSAGGGDQFLTEANGLTAFDLDAGAGNVNLTLTLGALADTDAAADITAGNATVVLSDATAQNVGVAANRIGTSVGGLSVDTSAGGGSQFLTEANGLTGLNLNAGAGDVDLTLTLGALADTDGATDITANQATVTLSEAAIRNFGAGANRIATSVNGLAVNTSAGGGDQFITEANGLTGLSLNAGAGDVDLTLTLGGVADIDAATDITAGDLIVTLSDAAVQNFGSGANAIQTSVGTLSVDTSAGDGSQFITEANGLTALDLDADGGNVTLNLTLGALADGDGLTDIRALNVDVGALGAGANIGTAAAPIEIDSSGGTVTLDARGDAAGGVHVEMAQAGDVTFTDSQTLAPAVRTLFTRGATTFRTFYRSDLTVRANGSINSTIAAGSSLLVPGVLTLNAAGGNIRGNPLNPVGIANPLAIDAGTLNAGAATGLSFSELNTVTLGNLSSTAGSFFVQAGSTLGFNASTFINAGAGGAAVLVANGSPGISVSAVPTTMNSWSRFLLYALKAELTSPPLIIDSMGNPSIGGLLADALDSPRAFNPATPDPFGDLLDYFVFSFEANPPTDPSLYIDIPVEVFQPVSIVFGEYDPTKFGEVGDLWMSSSELYEIERKAGKARKALPPQVKRAKYTPEAR